MRRLVNGTAAIWHRHVTRARQHRLASWSTGRIVAGPIASRPSAGLPPLSWLPSIAGKNIDQFVASLNTKLQRATQAGTSPAIETLMSRVLASDALHMRTRIIPLPSDLERDAIHPAILLIDERTHSAVDPDSRPTQRLRQFREMVSHACDLEHDASIWILRSNDPGSGPWLSSHVSLPDNTHILCANTSLRDLLRHVTRMYVVTASEGMGALLASVPLHVFGRPLYAGWGLTNDARSLPNRSARPTIAALFESLFVEHVRYLDPVTYDPGTLDVLLDFVEVQHSVARRFAGIDQLAGIRFQWWKRPFATPFLTAGGGRIRWTDGTHPARPGEFVAFWGARKADKLSRAPHLRIEDGFIHSAGLGSDMSPPRSQVVDRQGIYFDASAPSDLTDLLNHETFDDTELERAEALRHKIVSAGLTKYNLGRQAPTWRAPEGRTVVLVPGQVADDASIRLGTRSINSLDTLLRYVRERRPNAFIVYKPHPDVLSGNRNGLINAAQLANIVDSESDMISLIEAADEVHTLSSLAGFDALLRGKRVFTYGLPFYAGWGLTEDDLAPLPWRERTLSLDMLVAGALLRYPLYWDWQLKLFTTPEAVINQLSDAAARPLKTVARDHWRPYLKAFRWTRNALRHLSWRYQQNSAR